MNVYTSEAFKFKEKNCLVVDNISKWEDRETYNGDFTFKKFEEFRKAKQMVRKLKERFNNLCKQWNNIKKYEKFDREKLIKYIDKIKMEKHDELKRRYSKASRYVKYLEKKMKLFSFLNKLVYNDR